MLCEHLQKLKEFADNNFTFDENGRKFSNRFENTVGKGEYSRYKHFLLFPQCFQRLLLQTCKNKGLLGRDLSISQTNLAFYMSAAEVF